MEEQKTLRLVIVCATIFVLFLTWVTARWYIEHDAQMTIRYLAQPWTEAPHGR